MSNVIAPTCECVVDGEAIPLHDFFLIVGESGSRKSAAIKRALRLVRPIYQKMKLEGRIWYPEACTPEGIITALAEDPNRMMILTEWSELQNQGKAGYWQHTPQFFEMLFDRTPIQTLKSKIRTTIERPSLTILGASTPSLVRKYTSGHDWDAGKMARYVIGCWSKPDEMEMTNAIERPDLLPDLRLRYEQFFTPSLNTSFVPSADAKAYKDEWQYSSLWKDFSRSLPEHLKPSSQRAGDHVYRVATLYQASQTYPWEYVISEENMYHAIQFVWECLSTQMNFFGVLPGHEHHPLLRVSTTLKAGGLEGISHRDLLRKVQLHEGDVEKAIKTLVAREEVRRMKVNGGFVYFPLR
jgi:hypothetical protein